MTEVIQQLFNGLGLGTTYALIALAFALQFGVARVLNLAIGEVFTVGAFAALTAGMSFGSSAVSMASAIVASAIVGLIIYTTAIRPLGDVTGMKSHRHLAALVATVGWSIAIQNGLLILMGGYPRPVQSLFVEGQVRMGEVVIPAPLLFNTFAGAFLVFSLLALVWRTRFGLRVRAIASNRELALASGISAINYEVATVLISCALAGIAGALTADAVGAVSPFTGIGYGLKGLIIVIVSGPGNLVRSVMVALALGFTETLVVAVGSSSLRDLVAYSLLVGAVAFRPSHSPSANV